MGKHGRFGLLLVALVFLGACASAPEPSSVAGNEPTPFCFQVNPTFLERKPLNEDILVHHSMKEDQAAGTVEFLYTYREFRNRRSLWTEHDEGEGLREVLVSVRYASGDGPNLEEAAPRSIALVDNLWTHEKESMTTYCYQWILKDDDGDGIPDQARWHIITDDEQRRQPKVDAVPLAIDGHLMSYFEDVIGSVYGKFRENGVCTDPLLRESSPDWYPRVFGNF
jgi:hypothetical protein